MSNEDKLRSELSDCKQVVFKLENDLDFAKWENAEKDKSFLLELKNRLVVAWGNKDIAQYEMAVKMIDDWISELNQKGR